MSLSIRQRITRWAYTWHRKLIWVAAFALFCWTLSGITHPLMAWFGPQASTFFPPSLTLTTDQIVQFQQRLNTLDLSQARIIKLTPSPHGAAVQVTTGQHRPRHYYPLQAQSVNAEYNDRQHAIWLAHYYLTPPGQMVSTQQPSVRTVEFIDAFNQEYPSVNRLLPVYKISFATEDNLSVYIHTETNALASMNNDTKRILQTVFQNLHTWRWLDFTGLGRVLIVGLLIMTLFTAALSGLLLVINLRNRPLPPAKRWHRRLGYILWLPLLAWSGSGFYHLLQAEYIEPVSGMRLGDRLAIQQNINSNDFRLPALLNQQAVNAVSLIQHNSELFYRVSYSVPVSKVTREQRFQGRPAEKQAVYLTASTGELAALTDAERVRQLADNFYQTTTSEPALVTHFSPNYDFRNKRLPVWAVQVHDNQHRLAFIDPATGILVDQSRRVDRAERLTFSLAHKWNFLVPLIDRFPRDVIIVMILSLLIVTGVLGVRLQRNKRT